jgi:hypothetical protein
MLFSSCLSDRFLLLLTPFSVDFLSSVVVTATMDICRHSHREIGAQHFEVTTCSGDSLAINVFVSKKMRADDRRDLMVNNHQNKSNVKDGIQQA